MAGRKPGFIPKNKIIWTYERVAFLKKNWATMTNKELAVAMNLGLTSIRTKCYQLGMLRMEMAYWTKEQVQYLLDHYKTIGDVELAEIFEKKWPKNKRWTLKHIEKKRRYLSLKRTKNQLRLIKERNRVAGRFSINHWKRWYGREAAIGTVKVWHEEFGRPYKVIKTEDGYVYLSRKMWEDNFGPVPEKHQITFKDDDNMNVVPENLMALPIGCHPSFIKASTNLSDNYIAAQMSFKDPELRKLLLQHPDLLELKRQELLLNRTIKLQETA
jgi:HNH endonuclease